MVGGLMVPNVGAMPCQKGVLIHLCDALYEAEANFTEQHIFTQIILGSKGMQWCEVMIILNQITKLCIPEEDA